MNIKTATAEHGLIFKVTCYVPLNNGSDPVMYDESRIQKHVCWKIQLGVTAKAQDALSG